MKLLCLALAVILASVCWGANLTPTVSFTAPTTNADGSPIGAILGYWIEWRRPDYRSFIDDVGDGTSKVYSQIYADPPEQLFVLAPATSAKITLVCGQYWIDVFTQTVNGTIIGPTFDEYGGPFVGPNSAATSAPVSFDTGVKCPPAPAGLTVK